MAAKPDLSEFFKLSRPKRRPCAIGFALTQLSEPDGKQLEAACSVDPGVITNSAIQQWLLERKHESSISAVIVHRKGNCTCVDS